MTGCAAPPAQQSSGSGAQAAAADDDDALPPRARLRLSEIEPVPDRPQKPDELKSLSPRAVEQMARARSLTGQQRFTEATIELERALRYDPNHPAVHTALASLYWSADNPQRARANASRALASNPDIAQAHYLLARVAAGDEEHKEAINHYRTALHCSDFKTDRETAALCHYHLAESLAAEQYLTAALEQYEAFERSLAPVDADPGNTELATIVRINCGSAAQAKSALLERLGKYEEAASELQRLVDRGGADRALRIRHARLLLRAERVDEALDAARAIETADDDVIDVLSQIHQRLGKPEAIIDEIRARMSTGPDDPALLLHLAEAYVRLGRPAQCRQELEAYIAKHPDAMVVRLRLVDLHVDQRDWAVALQSAGDAVEHDPSQYEEIAARLGELTEDDKALDALLRRDPTGAGAGEAYLLGMTALLDERFDDAQSWLSQSLKQRPGFIPARAALGSVFVQTYRWNDAIQTTRRVEESSAQDARLEYVLGRAHEGLDDETRAERHYKAATQLNRADSRAMFALAKLYLRTGRQLQYERQLLALLKEDPLHEKARELLVKRYIAAGKQAEAESQISDLTRLSASTVLVARCVARLGLARTGDDSDFRRTLEEGMRRGGEDTATLVMLGDSHRDLRQYEQARRYYERAAALDPRDEHAAMGLVRVEYSLLEFEQAASLLETLLPRHPNRHAWRFAMLDLLAVSGDFEAALALARQQAQRADLKPEDRQTYRLAALQFLRLLRRDEQWVEQLESWAAAEETPGDWAVRLIGAYLDTDQAKPALPIAESMYRQAPDSITARSRLINVLAASDMHDRAFQHVLDWLDQDPQSPVTVRRLVSALEEAGRTDEALEWVRNQLAASRRGESLFDDMVSNMVWLLNRAERFSEAARFLDGLAQQGDPGRANMLHIVVAQELILAGKYQEAERRLVQVIDSSHSPSEVVKCLNLLATSYDERGLADQASQTLERALAIEPSSPSVNNNLGYMLADRGERLDEAERMIRLAVSKLPREVAYLDSLGWVLYKKGDFAGALKWLGRAVRADLNPDAVILDHLGDAAWRAGKRQEAIEHWQSAIEAADTRLEDDKTNAEARDTRDLARRKIQDVRTGEQPAVAPLGKLNR